MIRDPIESVAMKLTEARQKMKTVLEEFEKKLVSLKMEVSATVLLDRGVRFSFHSHGDSENSEKSWKLVLYTDKMPITLTNASHYHRIIMSNHLEDLLTQIIRQGEAEIVSLREAIAAVNKLFGDPK